jgi:glycosyltransferase involved in cell wall biosynthesis
MIEVTPLVTVVMSVFNAELYLVEAIESILNQTYKNFEFIIINDGSSDSSLEIINKYSDVDRRIRLISRENKGLPFSLNEALSLANGCYIARMDADDISLPNRLIEQVYFMEENPEIGISGSWAEVFRDGVTKSILKHPKNDASLRVKLLFSVCFVHPSVMIRKSVLSKHELTYDESYVTAQDYELWGRISKYTKMGNIQKVLLRYREVADSLTLKTESKLQLESKYLRIEKIYEKIFITMNIECSESERKLHYLVAVNLRLEKSKISLHQLSKYFIKISKANSIQKTFEERTLKFLLSRKFLIAVFLQRKNLGFKDLKVFKLKFFYSSLFYFVINFFVKEI